MSALTDRERDVLSDAGFDARDIDQLDALARRTPWLSQLRWMNRHWFWINMCAMTLILFAVYVMNESRALWALAFATAMLPALSVPLRRILTAVREPEASSGRTVLALAVRTAQENSGRSSALRELEQLAELVAEQGDVKTALTAHAADQRRSRIKLSAVATAMTALLIALYGLGEWLA